MTNAALGMLISIFCVLGLPVTFLSLRRRNESESAGWFTLLCASNIGWGVINAIEYFVLKDEAALILHDFKFVPIGFASIFTFLVVMGTLRRKETDKRAVACLLAFPVCTALACVAEVLFGVDLVSKNGAYMHVGDVRVFQAGNGPWFWLHCAFCYILLGFAAVQMVRHYVRMPRKYRSSAGILLIGISVTFAATLLAIFQVLPYAFDAGPLAAIVSLVFYYFAVFYPKSVDLLMSSREAVFEKARYPMLVLDSEQTIVDCNKYTAELGASLGMGSLQGALYGVFFERWMESSGAEIDGETPSIFTIHEEGGDTHYQITMNRIAGRKQQTVGTHVEIKNITPAMGLVHKLQEAAYYDQLTGLHNRNSFIRVGEEHDKAQTYPIGVLVGDLNNLKQVNDAYGHARGDILLQRMARILKAAKPVGSTAFRIGGDEFVVIAPGAQESHMEQAIADIHMYCGMEEDEEAPISVALGYHMKENPAQPLEHVVNIADKKMYQDKYDRRKG